MKNIFLMAAMMGFLAGVTHPAHAGRETGNGGGAWICRNSDGSIRWAELVDLWEAENEFGLYGRFTLQIPRHSELSTESQIESMKRKIQSISPNLYPNVVKRLKQVTESIATNILTK